MDRSINWTFVTGRHVSSDLNRFICLTFYLSVQYRKYRRSVRTMILVDEIRSEMLSLLYRQLKPRITWQRRFLTQGLLQSSSTPPPSLLTSSPSASKNLQEKPYYVPRNSKGNLPVYSDIRNAGSRPLVHIRNVEGDISVRLSPVLIPVVVFIMVFIDASKRTVAVALPKRFT